MKQLLVLFILCIALTGCEKKQEFTPVTEYYFDVALTGKGGLPETLSKATATFKGTYYASKRVLAYTLTYNEVIPTGMAFYKGAKDVAGTQAINIASTAFITPYQNVTAELTTAQITELLTGQWYIAIRSALYSNGEIRGQLVSTHN